MNESIINEILINILNNDKIAIFRHSNPDGDAIFSQYGFKQFIKDNFKDKHVKCLGNEECDLLPKLEKASDKYLKESLGIVLDTSNTPRIDDDRFKLCKYLIKIDHHPNLDKYGNINLVEDFRSSTCELLADILLEYEKMGYVFSNKCAKLLLSGILTDSNSFTTSSTSSKTLEIASKLVNKDINISKLNIEIFSKSKEEFEIITLIRNSIKFNEHFAYCFFDNKDLKKLNLDYKVVKNNVNDMARIKGINVWCIIVYNPTSKLYECSVRANDGYVINDVMSKYGGGGHKQAAACKNFKKTQVQDILNDLSFVANK